MISRLEFVLLPSDGVYNSEKKQGKKIIE